jgi:hypothetical protein
MRHLLIIAIILTSFKCLGQTAGGQFIKDKQKSCLVWASNFNPSDSLTISWDGGCKNEKADGFGTLIYYIKNKEVAKYHGSVVNGDANGKGKFSFPNGMIQEGTFINGILNGQGQLVFPDTTKRLVGNFYDGEILNLDTKYLNNLKKVVISKNDSTDLYVNDRNEKDLFYYSLVPDKPIKGVLVLLAGTWDRAEYVLSNNKQLSQLAFANNIAVLVPSINQRLTLNTEVLNFLNDVFKNAIRQYSLPSNKFIIGGFSMGGLFSIRYTELAYQDSTKTAVKPIAVYSVDGPTDLENMYYTEERALERSPNKTEPTYALNEFKKNIGGTPDSVRKNYVYYSTFSSSEKDGGNAKYLKTIPIRIYNDVDVNWWLTNRNEDLYDMNALDQSAMINFLRRAGNQKAEFINAYKKGYRLDGTRHPHSWSIVDAVDCINWIKDIID